MEQQKPELVLLDIMLPEEDGLSILRRLRMAGATKELPVIMLTAKNTEYDRVIGLDNGADDFISKPFGMMEMVSRVRALLRRSSRSVGERRPSLQVGPLELWPSRRTATLEGEPLSLTMREFDLLEFIMRSPGEVFSRETLLRRVWGWDFDGGSRTVDVHVQTIRSKLGQHSDMIQTVRGVGYRMRASS
jgi:two-component system alkaline phosphatase synthesis response regulator PhoP